MARAISESVIENRNGRLEIFPACPVQALSWGSWKFRWTLGFDLEPGGGLELVLMPRFPTNRWSLPQTSDPTAAGYVTAKVEGEALATVDILRWPVLLSIHDATIYVIRVTIANEIREFGQTTMKKGQTIEFTYGDKRGGSMGTQAPACARKYAFPIFFSSGRQPKFFEEFIASRRIMDMQSVQDDSDFCPTLKVIGGPAHSFNVVGPMEVAPGQPFELRISVLDSAANPASGYEGLLNIRNTDVGSQGHKQVSISGPGAKASGLSLTRPGFHRISVIDENLGLLGVSNPIRVVKNPQRVYWGDLHAHCQMSLGVGTPDEHYSYARDVAFLDFASVNYNDLGGAKYNESWFEQHPQRLKFGSEKVKQYSQPGEFVAFLAYETRVRRHSDSSFFGDINVYYLADEGEPLEQFFIPLDSSIAQGKEVLLVPHTPLYHFNTGMGVCWEYLQTLPTELIPLVEIFSTHGNSEYFDCPRHVLGQGRDQSVIDALKKGFRLGFIGSSDYHESLCGGLLRIQDQPKSINNQHMQGRCGLAAVRCDHLSRDSLFQAMRARQTYATSGIRAYVDFSVNGNQMGTEFRLSSADEPRVLRIAVAAPEGITKLQVIRNGEPMAELANGQWFVETEITDVDPIPEGAFYYLRATTQRTDFAWSSPVWVDV